MPRIFGRKNLAALDPAPFEDEEGRPLTPHFPEREKADAEKGTEMASSSCERGGLEQQRTQDEAPIDANDRREIQ